MGSLNTELGMGYITDWQHLANIISGSTVVLHVMMS